MKHTVYSPDSHGKLGGKSAGLFVAEQDGGALREARRESQSNSRPQNLVHHLGRDAAIRTLQQPGGCLRPEVPRDRPGPPGVPDIVQVFKNSPFPPELTKGFVRARRLRGSPDHRPQFEPARGPHRHRPSRASTRASSWPTRARKQERLEALQDAIAEVYASIFGPDPIEYRAERGLLDVHEEMGIMIQEVVGTRVGKYFLPAFSGVAFSNNEFRWSPPHPARGRPGPPGAGSRHARRGPLERRLPGPGRPRGSRACGSTSRSDEIVRYSPEEVDVINLETNAFETVELRAAACARSDGDYPWSASWSRSVERGDMLRQARAADEPDSAATTRRHLRGLLDGHAVRGADARALLTVLRRAARSCPSTSSSPHDGKDLYLLQCRPQSYRRADAPAPIPRGPAATSDVRLLGQPLRLQRPRPRHHPHRLRRSRAPTRRSATLEAMRGRRARVVGRLNKLLPKRQFILMGPGRWGSRGDIKLGVSVTYADINNTAVLIEIARQEGNYVPDLSFGTHFFQDLVEARHPLPAALPRRAGGHLQRDVPAASSRTSSRSCCPSSPTSPTSFASSTSPRRRTVGSCGC